MSVSDKLVLPVGAIAAHSTELIERAVHLAANAMFMADRHGRICWINCAFTRLYGYEAHEVLGRTPSVLKSGRQSTAFYEELWTTLCAGRVWRGHLCNRHRDGHLLDVNQTVTPIGDAHGQVTHFFVVYEDITERLRSERKLTRLALYDSLTGLPNRHHFDTRLRDALARRRRQADLPAVLLLDLDHFKRVNDTLGHAAGDALLVRVARRMAAVLEEGALLARLSGDEFAVLFDVLPAALPVAETVAAAAQGLIDALAAPFAIQGTEVRIGASVGIALAAGATEDGASLMRRADLAMYEAKRQGRGRYCLHAPDLDHAVSRPPDRARRRGSRRCDI